MHSIVQPNAWVGLKLPSENVRVMQIAPNTTISLGKYGSFPSNLIIHRPYHLTYEILDRQPNESFSRLRVVPTSELYADVFADEAPASSSAEDGVSVDDTERIISAQDGVEYSLVDIESQAVIARSNREIIDDSARQTLTNQEIEELKREGTDAGKDLIAKLMLSHTALDQKTAFSLAKYKLLKTKKYIRRFSVVPLDVGMVGNWLLEGKDVGSKIMELREEMIGLVGCWANVHYGGDDRFLESPKTNGAQQQPPSLDEACPKEELLAPVASPEGGRWLMVDDTGGLLVAAMAERMGILYGNVEDAETPTLATTSNAVTAPGGTVAGQKSEQMGASEDAQTAGQENPADHDNHKPGPSGKLPTSPHKTRRRHIAFPNDDLRSPFSLTNTLTLIHSNTQPTLTYLNYFGFDHANPDRPPHPLNEHLCCLTWLQLLNPECDSLYSSEPPQTTDEVLASWKANRRGTYHRKRRRWARTRHIVDTTRAGGFSGLVVATTMDLASVLRHTIPLLAGGAPIAIYSPTLEPLTQLADCFSVARRSAWMGSDPPAEAVGKSVEELERWEGTEEFPLNPTLLLGVTIQTSRVRKWQVLPGRTHPIMTGRGGAEGYVFTASKVRPAEGKIAARGKFKRRKAAANSTAAVDE